MKLVIDKSSIVGAYLHTKDEEYGEDIHYKGKDYHIPSPETCLERFQTTFERTVHGYFLRTTDVLVVKDPIRKKSQRTIRNDIFPEYNKTKRESPPEFFAARKELFALVDDWLKTQGCMFATPPPQFEADDLINEIARRFDDVLIWTRDKDLLACPANVLLVNAKTSEVNPHRFPVPDEFIHLYRAIVTGDASDGLSSAKGFGPAAWDGMIEVFGPDALPLLDELIREERLEELEEDVPEYKKLQLIIDDADNVYQTYKCMQFYRVPAHKVKWEIGMRPGTDTLVTRENFDMVLELLEALEFDYSVIDYEADVPAESVEWLEQTGKDDNSRVRVDVMASEICGMGLRIGYDNWYFSVQHKDTDNITLDQLESVLEVLYGKRVYAHNSTGFENVVTYNHFGAFLPDMWDTTIMACYVDENDHTNLKHLSKKHLGYNQTTYEQVLDGRSGMFEVSGEEVLRYGLDDVITCDALQVYFSTIMAYEGTLKVFEEVEVNSAYVTSLCFIGGADFDHDKHKELREANRKNIDIAWEKLNASLLKLGWPGGKFSPIRLRNFGCFERVFKAVYGKDPDKSLTSTKAAVEFYAGEEIAAAFGPDGSLEDINLLYKKHWEPKAELNLRSPKQMADLLYGKEYLNLPVRIRKAPTELMRKKGKKGSPATDEEAMNNAIAFGDAGEHEELLKAFIEYKGFLTRESLFFSKYHKFVHWKTGKLHSSMRQAGAQGTRRFTHSKPNLAQLSKKKGKEMRDMITVPDDDWYIWTFDIDSQELKLQAEVSQCKAFLSCYTGKVKKDVHAMTGNEVAIKQGVDFGGYEKFEKLLDADAKPFRVKGKATNFATSYLCKAKKLGNMLGITESEAATFIAAKDSAFPGLMPAINRYIKKCRQRKYSLTMMGARKHLAVAYAKARNNDGATAAVDRLGWSFRIQGSAGEQIRLSMSDMWKDRLFDEYNWPITVIHDEIVGRIHKSVMEERMPRLHKAMTRRYANMSIETTSTPEVGKSLGALSKWEGNLEA